MLPANAIYFEDPHARMLLERANGQRYRLPSSFPGFTASLRVQINQECWEGDVRVGSRKHVHVYLAAAIPGALVRTKVQSMLLHRWPTPIHERDGRYALALDSTPHPCGTCVRLCGDPLHSTYHISDEGITLVSRTIGPQQMAIAILDSQQTANGTRLPTHFTLAIRERATRQLLRADSYTDRYVAVQGYMLPQRRQAIIHAAHHTTCYTLELSNHRLNGTHDILAA
ncbi:MAG: DUF3386 domain-containing protein [Chloroflexaceae bacterium]|jgi:hypothetical protein|nr:DUF3386 domain-containing protein [Chloroflexaceae bacterium]